MIHRVALIPLLGALALTLACRTMEMNEPTDQRRAGYPAHWWAPLPESEVEWWEVPPQAAGPGEVVLSKRNELGILSNFAHTPFELHGVRYESVEGFWQMMKFPEGPEDPRAQFEGIEWPHRRDEVAQMIGFEAKAAGDLASENMRTMGIDWVTFEGRQMPYWTTERGEHFDLIVEAMRAKLDQNPEVREVLLSTGDLTLRADHHQEEDWPPAWFYNEIWMELRGEMGMQ